MVRVGEDQEILTLSEPLQSTKEVLPKQRSITTEPSHRFTGAHQCVNLRLF